MVLAFPKWDSFALSWNTWLQTGAVFLPRKQTGTFYALKRCTRDKEKKIILPPGETESTAAILRGQLMSWT